MLQQYLPFTVLKLSKLLSIMYLRILVVATVLTVYGIETTDFNLSLASFIRVATVLTVYGIETHKKNLILYILRRKVATVLTVYGIETLKIATTNFSQMRKSCNSTYRLRY